MTSASSNSDDWYEVVEYGEDLHALEQGDILPNFRVSIGADVESERPTIKREYQDVVVLTQTCDIPKPTQPTILLAKVVSYDELCSTNQFARGKDFRKSLVDGQNAAFFLLRERSGVVDIPWSVVSFRELSLAIKREVQNFASSTAPRLRLRSPYKENLAQGFARFMMRVGLPLTARDFLDYKPVK